MTDIRETDREFVFAGFRVYKDGVAESDVLPFTQTTFDVYYVGEYTVKTVFTTGNVSEASNEVVVHPAAVTDLTAPEVDATNVVFRPTFIWTNPTCAFRTGFRIYLRADDDDFEAEDVVVTIDDPDATTWTHNATDLPLALEQGTEYFWQVVAFAGEVDATGSTVSSFTTVEFVTISDFTATPTNDKQIELEWTVSSIAGVEGFRVFRSITNEIDDADDISGLIPVETGITEYDFIDDDVEEETKYYYWIKVHYVNGYVDTYGYRDAIVLPCDCGVCEECENDTGLSVSMSTFSASVMNQSGASPVTTVSINWTTASESGVRGFHLLRKDVSALQNVENVNNVSDAILITQYIIPVTNTVNFTSYQFTDNNVTMGGEYFYWIQSIANDGSVTLHGPMIVKVTTPCMEIIVPLLTAVSSVYPNPVRTNANFDINVKEGETATLRVFNARGQIVRDFTDIRTGTHNIVWDRRDNSGREVGSGVYFYRLTSPSVDNVRRMIVVR